MYPLFRLICIRNSNLNFNISESSFFLTVTIKYKDGSVQKPELKSSSVYSFQQESSTQFSTHDFFPDPDNYELTWNPSQTIASQEEVSPKAYHTTHLNLSTTFLADKGDIFEQAWTPSHIITSQKTPLPRPFLPSPSTSTPPPRRTN